MKTLVIIITFILLSSFLYSTIRNVPGTYSTIQAGINTAVNTDTVLVQPGTYVENINFNGKLITVGSLFLTTADTSYISTTIIDGNETESVVTFNHGEDISAILCGFTITNGKSLYGSGICCFISSPKIQNVIITFNVGPAVVPGVNANGGGIFCDDSSPILQNVTISGNYANFGGGIACSSSSPSLENVAITGNSASNFGGGICCGYGSNLSLTNVTISDNHASINGGGISCNSANPSLINSIMWDDSPQEIYISDGSVTATYSNIQGGWAGIGNIDCDPLFVDSPNGDYHLSWDNYPIQDATMSPCIDTGDSASPLDPDSTIADMGALYFNQTTALDPPQNVTIEVNAVDVNLSWDAVTDALSYKVYSSDDPFTGFEEDTSGAFTGESWSTSIINEKKFYNVIANDQPY